MPLSGNVRYVLFLCSRKCPKIIRQLVYTQKKNKNKNKTKKKKKTIKTKKRKDHKNKRDYRHYRVEEERVTFPWFVIL